MKSSSTISESFQVIGISVRTNNKLEMSSEAKIGKLWHQYISENVASKIAPHAKFPTISLYHKYESDMNGDYTVTIGLKLPEDFKAATENFDKILVPKMKVQKITSASGKIPEIVINAWKDVWSLTSEHFISRNYTYDYELYDERALNPQQAQIDLFISVK